MNNVITIKLPKDVNPEEIEICVLENCQQAPAHRHFIPWKHVRGFSPKEEEAA